jgi:hypothetical protein
VTVTATQREGEEEASASDALRQRVKAVLDEIAGKTDIILDVSSLPRATYLALLTNILHRLVPEKVPAEGKEHPLYASGSTSRCWSRRMPSWMGRSGPKTRATTS